MGVRRRPASWSQGSCAHSSAQGSGHKPRACAGAAQYMFSSASSFNQPLEAWDVGQVISMTVRRRPASVSQGFTHSCACGAATNRVRVRARCRACSPGRAPSTSPWQRGTSRSPTCMCAAALRQGHRAPAHTRRSGGHKPCACAGAAQSMFSRASAFNQPVEAWDVGQVTNMQVCRRPAFDQGLVHTHSCSGERPQAVSACAGVAQSMFSSASAFNQPLEAWDVGQVKYMQVRRGRASMLQGFTHSCARGAATSCVRVLARRRKCSETRALSTSVWLHGTLVRSPTWLCAAPLRVGLVRT